MALYLIDFIRGIGNRTLPLSLFGSRAGSRRGFRNRLRRLSGRLLVVLEFHYFLGLQVENETSRTLVCEDECVILQYY
jgi:hypothetical protein